MLTEKQRDLLLYIDAHLRENGVSPSFDEMKEALGLKSKSGIHRLISALEERGYLERLHNRARALEVRKLPENTSGASSAKSNNVTPFAPKAGSGFDMPANSSKEFIPLLGKIAAGTPIEAIQHHGEYIEFPLSFMGPGDYYALRVEGDSMINAGINNRDIAIIRKAHNARDGAIIVALVDGEEATLKRLRRSKGKVILEAENDEYEDRELEADRIKVQGELASILRVYN
ncbi:MAG: transcriptional repressor LexA [Alphaproteobacteria bacterium]|nr:transcriptional repressor LexA [Alphaproteobacteria bacterium]